MTRARRRRRRRDLRGRIRRERAVTRRVSRGCAPRFEARSVRLATVMEWVQPAGWVLAPPVPVPVLVPVLVADSESESALASRAARVLSSSIARSSSAVRSRVNHVYDRVVSFPSGSACALGSASVPSSPCRTMDARLAPRTRGTRTSWSLALSALSPANCHIASAPTSANANNAMPRDVNAASACSSSSTRAIARARVSRSARSICPRHCPTASDRPPRCGKKSRRAKRQ